MRTIARTRHQYLPAILPRRRADRIERARPRVYETGGYSCLLQQVRDAVHRVALPNAAQVEFHSRREEMDGAARRIQRDISPTYASSRLHQVRSHREVA